jgi:hypothetical protein
MKKKILTSVIAAIIMMAGLSVFAQQDKQAEKARKNVAKAEKDLKEAKLDSAADYEKFVKDAEMNISENKKVIVTLKEKKIEQNKEANDKYNKEVLALEKKNNDLEKRIKDSQHTKTNMWERFKLNFSRDMEKLGQAIKRI